MDRRKILLVLAALVAALGTMLVWLYVQGAEDRAEEGRAEVTVLVASKNIDQGEKFSSASSAGKFVEADIPKDAVLPGALTELDAIEGKVALAPIYEGEQLLAAKWGGADDIDVTADVLTIPKGEMAMTVQLTDPARVAGFVKPGSEVAVLSAMDKDSAADGIEYTRTIVLRADVLAVGATSTLVTSTKTDDNGDSTTGATPQTLVTLSLTQKEAERVLFAAQFGDEIALALVNDDSELDETPKTVEARLVPWR